MKKLIVLLLCTVFILAGCAANAAYDAEAPAAPAPEPEYYARDEEAVPEAEEPADDYYAYSEDVHSGLGSVTGNITTESDRKLIYTAEYTIETASFADDYEKIVSTAEKYNGYISNENTSGTAPKEHTDAGRLAMLTLRIPVENYTAFTKELAGVGSVVEKNQSVSDITAEYVDTESRIEMLETKYDKLNEHLKKAELMEDIITLETEMGNVLYELDILKGQMREYDNLIDYTTIEVRLNEIVKLSTTEVEGGFWQDAGEGFTQTLAGVGTFFENLGIFLISASPVLILMGVITAIVLVTVFSIRKRNKKKREKTTN